MIENLQTYSMVMKVMNDIRHKKSFSIPAQVSKKSYFHDLIWDFSEYNFYNFGNQDYVYNFKNIPQSYLFYVKLVILAGIAKKNRMSTIYCTYKDLVTIINKFIVMNISDPIMIDQNYISMVFDSSSASKAYIAKVAGALKKMLLIIAEHSNVDFKVEIQLLKSIVKDSIEQRTVGTNQYIPDRFYDQIIALGMQELNDVQQSTTMRLYSGMIVILATTGMRIGELIKLETGQMNSIVIGNKEEYYLNFTTFKTTENLSRGKKTFAYLFPVAAEAYKKCCSLVDSIVDDLSNEVLAVNISNYFNKEKKGNSKNVSWQSIKKQYSEKQIAKVIQELKKYLFIDQYGRIIKLPSNFRFYLQRFFIRNSDKFKLDDMSDYECELIDRVQITSAAKYEKIFSRGKGFLKKYPYEKYKDKEYYYANPHRFRVTVCTKLFRQNVGLDYIIKHMNHLSEDMTLYYDRSREFENSIAITYDIVSQICHQEGKYKAYIDKEKSQEFEKILSDDEIIRNLNEIKSFIQNNEFMVMENIDKILNKMQRRNCIISENYLGICVGNIVQRICDKKMYFSSATDYYFLNPKDLSYKFLHMDFIRFYDKQKLIEHNHKIIVKYPQNNSEYEQEVKIMKYYVQNNIVNQISLLEEDIGKIGRDTILTENHKLNIVLENLDQFKKDVVVWIN